MRYDYASMGFYTFDCLGRPVENIPPNGDTYFIDDLTLAVSGAAGSAAIAAAKHGLSVLAVGGVGDDLMGDWVLARLESFGVDASAMQRAPGWRTSSSIVTTRPDGARPALHMRGATADFFVDDADFARVTDAHVFHIGGIGLMDRMDRGQNARLMAAARARGAATTLDIFASSPADLPLVEEVLPATDYFIPSIEEAQALSGLADRDEAARFFIDRGAGACVLTLGAGGAYYRDADGLSFHVPAYAVEVVCTCGCGDTFNAGFATGLVKGLDIETTVRFAQATSGLNATGLGSQAGVRSYAHTFETMERWPISA